MKVLMIGDVVARPGRLAVLERIQDLREQHEIDLVVMNAENVAGGFSITPRLADVNWAHGRLVSPPTPPEPPGLDRGAAKLLDEAEDIVNAAGPRILAELGTDRRSRLQRPAKGLGRWWRRRRNPEQP